MSICSMHHIILDEGESVCALCHCCSLLEAKKQAPDYLGRCKAIGWCRICGWMRSDSCSSSDRKQFGLMRFGLKVKILCKANQFTCYQRYAPDRHFSMYYTVSNMQVKQQPTWIGQDQKPKKCLSKLHFNNINLNTV